MHKKLHPSFSHNCWPRAGDIEPHSCPNKSRTQAWGHPGWKPIQTIEENANSAHILGWESGSTLKHDGALLLIEANMLPASTCKVIKLITIKWLKIIDGHQPPCGEHSSMLLASHRCVPPRMSPTIRRSHDILMSLQAAARRAHWHAMSSQKGTSGGPWTLRPGPSWYHSRQSHRQKEPMADWPAAIQDGLSSSASSGRTLEPRLASMESRCYGDMAARGLYDSGHPREGSERDGISLAVRHTHTHTVIPC